MQAIACATALCAKTVCKLVSRLNVVRDKSRVAEYMSRGDVLNLVKSRYLWSQILLMVKSSAVHWPAKLLLVPSRTDILVRIIC